MTNTDSAERYGHFVNVSSFLYLPVYMYSGSVLKYTCAGVFNTVYFPPISPEFLSNNQ